MHLNSQFVLVPENDITVMKKALRETQTLPTGCSKAPEPKKISPHRRPHSGGAGRPTFNQLETVTTFTYKLSLVRHAISSYRSNRPTNKQTQQTHTHTHKQTGPITVHCAAASAQCDDRPWRWGMQGNCIGLTIVCDLPYLLALY